MKKFLLLSVTIPGVLMLGGCAHAVRPVERITIETPGAEGAICFVERPGYRQRVWAPQTVTVEKTMKPLGITCRASGNREQTVVFDPSKERTAEWGDFFPRKILVDFREVQLKRQQLPAQEFVTEQPAPEMAPEMMEYYPHPTAPEGPDMAEPLPPPAHDDMSSGMPSSDMNSSGASSADMSSASDMSASVETPAPAPMSSPPMPPPSDPAPASAPPAELHATMSAPDAPPPPPPAPVPSSPPPAAWDSAPAKTDNAAVAPPPAPPASGQPVPITGSSVEDLTRQMNPKVFAPQPPPPAPMPAPAEKVKPTPILPQPGDISPPAE